MPHHEDLDKKIAPKPEAKECHCGDKCECGCNCGCGCGCCCGKKFVAKLIMAVIIFLAGFGCAHLCCCCRHYGKMMMPAQHEMLKHKGHHGYNGGAGTMIIINADGKAEMMPRPEKHHKMKHFPHHKDMPQNNEKPTGNKPTE